MKLTNRVLVVGLGLIGSSFAQAIKHTGLVGEVIGVSRSPSTLFKALDMGVVDRCEEHLSSALDQLSAGDVVMIATPTLTVKSILQQCGDALRRGVIVTDGASVKGNIEQDARSMFPVEDLRHLVLGHPIAGSEKSGVEAANPKLYINHRVILTPLPETDAESLELVTKLWQACGAVVNSMSVQEHDLVLAATSHLPHVLAFALVDALSQQKENHDIFKYAAGGFKDFTRIASSDPVMWHDILLANSDAVLERMDQLQQQLEWMRKAILAKDSDAILSSFKRANAAREHFLNLYQNLGA
jgi:prephenate dehydrogenase